MQWPTMVRWAPLTFAFSAWMAAGQPAWAETVPASALPQHEFCLATIDATAVTAAQIKLEAILKRAQAGESPLFKIAREQVVSVCIDPHEGLARGFFEPARNMIALRDTLSTSEAIVILLHELRHLDQFSRGHCASIRFDVREEVRFAFMVEADAMAITADAVWTLKQRGDHGPWDTFVDLQDYGDIAEAYAAVKAVGGTRDAALTAAFTQWFQSDWRRESYDHAACMAYYDQLDQSKKLQRYELRSDEALQAVCTLPDGGTYECALPDNLQH